MKYFGIDKINFYTPRYYLNAEDLALHYNLPKDIYHNSIGLHKIAIPPPNEDIVSMGANASFTLLENEDIGQIDTLIFATESGIDQSKAAGIYVHKLLNLSPRCRVIELKQACYAATFGLNTAIALLQQNPKRKILLIASDVARYELGSNAEAAQGCGAVAMLLTANPRTMLIEPENAFITRDVMDFWRPNYRTEPLVYGTYSCDIYLHLLTDIWQQYTEISQRNFADHHCFCFHVPVPKLAEKAYKRLLNTNQSQNDDTSLLMDSLKYAREIGNCYTASMYLSLISLLENSAQNLGNKRVGFYSYGSGCVCEFFSGIILPGYEKIITKQFHIQLLTNRTELSYAEYLEFYNYKLPTDGSLVNNPECKCGKFKFLGINEHKRIYG